MQSPHTFSCRGSITITFKHHILKHHIPELPTEVEFSVPASGLDRVLKGGNSSGEGPPTNSDPWMFGKALVEEPAVPCMRVRTLLSPIRASIANPTDHDVYSCRAKFIPTAQRKDIVFCLPLALRSSDSVFVAVL